MQAWWVILFIAVALSPLVWLRPSPRQRDQMAVRLAARRQGLGMQLAQEDWPYWMEERAPARCAQYHRPRRQGGDSWCFWQVTPGLWQDRWREPCSDAQLLSQLSRLPGDAYKIEANRQMISLFWGEQGGEPALQTVAAVLAELA